MTIRAITAVLTIAGSTFVLTACDEHQEASGSAFFKALGVNDLAASPAPAVAYVTEVVEEVTEPPAKVWKCWEEPRRAGTYFETVCDWFAP
jgi:hypothetical protein